MTGTRAPLPAMPAPDRSVPHVVAPARRRHDSAAWSRLCSCGPSALGWTKEEADRAACQHLEAGREHAERTAQPDATASAAPGAGVRTPGTAETVSAPRGPHWIVVLVAFIAELAESTDAPRAGRVLEGVPVQVREEADAWRRAGGAG